MMMMPRPLLLLLLATVAHGWVTPTATTIASRRSTTSTTQRQMMILPTDDAALAAVLDFSTTTPTVLLAEEVAAWRQYVPLVVSLLVITDILLGRPVASAVMAPLQAVQEEFLPDASKTSKKERVDTNAIAQEALDQARTMMELNAYLESNKTEEQLLYELRMTMDKDMQQVDATLKARQEKIDKGEY
eukprot:CAMPEP_0119006556 /NCGR_PEP_ID=MMETSP1176-20130426/2368_1 /TAXON_ID=265551 /ORGANISM="Synedropsis recta cf, Strain CCMP1620" /LENGTH=187 /DNA_ID=CAMNT_0006958485 /DNA_START=36 /DNA_END=599 /DNA_ORIENTATION=-